MNTFKLIITFFIISAGIGALSQASSDEAHASPSSARPLPSFNEAQRTQLQRLGLCETYADGKDFLENAPLSSRDKSTPLVMVERLIRDAISNKHPLSLMETPDAALMLRVQLGRGPANFALQNWRSSDVALSIVSQLNFLLQIRF